MLFFDVEILLHHGGKRCHILHRPIKIQNARSAGPPSVAARTRSAAARASALLRLLHRHRVAAVDSRVDDGVHIIHHRLQFSLCLVVGGHALVCHDVVVQLVHLHIQLVDLILVLVRAFGKLAVQVDAGKIKVSDQLLKRLG